MTQRFSAARHCPNCGTANGSAAEVCRVCGASLYFLPGERRRGVALLMNEIARLVDEGVLPPEAHGQTSARYQRELETTVPAPETGGSMGVRFWLGIVLGIIGLLSVGSSPEVGVTLMLLGGGLVYWGYNAKPAPRIRREEPRLEPAPSAPTREPPPRPQFAPGTVVLERPPEQDWGPAAPERPSRTSISAWLPEQEANLLLYLGAFLIVVATLVLVGSSQRTIGPEGNMALLVTGTTAFMAAGLICVRGARVRQAGIVFIVVAALMVPLNFVGVYAFFLDEREIDPTGLWLGGSLASALFYAAVSFLGVGRWYPAPAAGALISALAAGLTLVDAPVEVAPTSFILLGMLFVAPAQLPLGRVSEVFGRSWYWAGHIVVALALPGGLLLSADHDYGWLWFGASLASFSFFTGVAWPRADAWQHWPAAASLAGFLGACLELLDAPVEVAPAAFILLGLILVMPSLVHLGRPSDVLGKTWFWSAHVAVGLALAGGLRVSADSDYGWLWLGASLASIAFFASIAWLRADAWQRWPGVPALAALLASCLVLLDTPMEAYAVAYSLFAAALAVPLVLRLGKMTAIFALPFLSVAYVSAAGALVAALDLLDQEVTSRWYLPVTMAAVSGFFWVQTWRLTKNLVDAIGLRRAMVSALNLIESPDPRPVLGLGALLTSGAVAMSLVFAFDLERQWYGPMLVAVAGVYAVAATPWAPFWPGRPFLGWLAPAAASVSWAGLAFGGAEAQTAGSGFAAAVIYMSLARLYQADERVIAVRPVLEAPGVLVQQRLAGPVVAVLTYASGAALSFGFFNLLDATPLVDTSNAVDVAYAFFGLSLAIAAVSFTTRWWWPEIRLHVYGVALIMGILVFVAAAAYQDKAPVVLTVYAVVALALTLVERQPLGLAVSAAFAFFAVLAGWRYLEPQDAYAPLLLSVLGAAVVLAHSYLGSRLGRYKDVLLPIGVVYIGLVPAVSFVRLLVLIDPDVPWATWPHDPSLLYQFTLAAILVVSAGLAVWTPLLRLGEVIVAAALGVLAVGLAAWPNLQDEYLMHADYATSLHAASFVLFVVAARLVATRRELALYAPSDEPEPLGRDVVDERRWTMIGLVYAGGVALNATVYYLLDAASILDTADRAAVSWAFFGLSCVEAAMAVAARWAWTEIRRHVFLIAEGTSILSLATAANLDGQVLGLLLLYAILALALSAWEREPAGLSLAAAYAFVAVFAGQRYSGANEALVPLALSAMACGAFAGSVVLQRAKAWALAASGIAFAYGVLAPVVAGVWLASLVGAGGYVGDAYFLETDLYQAGVLSLAVLGVLVAGATVLKRRLLAAGFSSIILLGALLLEIAHFRPDEVQAYTVPIGLYFIAATLLTSRYGRLPEDLSPILERLYGLGPTIVMAPSFIQSLDYNAWEYGLALLLESVAFLALALPLRRVWLLTIAVTFVVANALHYLFFSPELPTWATLSIIGVLLMAAGTAVLVGRDRWPELQSAILAWWQRTPRFPGGTAQRPAGA